MIKHARVKVIFYCSTILTSFVLLLLCNDYSFVVVSALNLVSLSSTVFNSYLTRDSTHPPRKDDKCFSKRPSCNFGFSKPTNSKIFIYNSNLHSPSLGKISKPFIYKGLRVIFVKKRKFFWAQSLSLGEISKCSKINGLRHFLDKKGKNFWIHQTIKKTFALLLTRQNKKT